LYDICIRCKPSYLIQGADDLDESWFREIRGVGITAGASTPDYVIAEVEERIRAITGGTLT